MQKLFIIAAIFFINSTLLAQRPQLMIQSGHQSEIEMASISVDGKYLLSVEQDSKAILWEMASGKQLRIFKEVMAAGFSTDGKSIEMVMDDYTFLKTDFLGNTLQTYSKSSGPDRNHRLLYSYYPESGIFDWNGLIYQREKGKLLTIQIPHYGLAHHYSEKLGLLAVASPGFITLCQIPSGSVQKTLNLTLEKDKDMKFVKFSPDGRYILAGSKTDVEVLDVESGKSLYVFKYGDLSSGYSRYFTVLNATFSPDSKQLLVLARNELLLYDLSTGKVIWKTPQTEISVNEYGVNCGVLLFSPDGKQIIFGGTKKMQLADARTGALSILFTGSSAAWLDQNTVINNDQQLIVKSQRTHLINWNLSSGEMEKAIPIGDIDEPVSISSDGKSIFTFRDRNFAKRLNTSGETQKEYATNVTANFPNTISQSFDGKYVATAGRFSCDTCKSNFYESYNLYVYDALSGKKLLSRIGDVAVGAFANRSNILAVKDQFDKYPLRFLDIPSGKLLFEVATPGKSEWPSKLKFSPNDKFVAIHSAAIYIIEPSTKKIITIKSDLPNGSGCTAAAFSPDEKYYAMGSNDGKVFFFDIAAEKFIPEFSIDVSVSRIEGISFTKSGNYLFVNSIDNLVQLWNLKTHKLSATLYPNLATTDWAVICPDGRFDASVNAQSYMFYVKGLDVLPLSALFEQFYTPDLLPRLLAGEVFPPVLIDLDNIKQAPVVKIQYQQSEQRNLEVADDIATYMNTTGVAEITVNAFSKDDVVDEIRLFHNGKIVTLTTRNLIVADENTSKEATKKYTVNLLPGENKLRALALNSQRTESTPADISVIYSAKNASPQKTNTGSHSASTPVAEVDKTATLHLIVVGINQYKNPAMSLNYALADATAFKDELEKDAKTIITNIKTYFVTDNTATKSGITAAFGQVQQIAKPQDIFVFYYAGHGVIGKDKEFYLVPNDVSDLKNVQAELETKGIPAKLLQQYAIDIPAQKQLFILDACQSAGAFNEMLSADGDQQKSIAVVSRSTGTHWMAASGAQQFANEFSQLGHGAFTYVLLEALKGSAAADKMITVNGLKNYLQQGVPELMKKYSGTLQYPASYGFGNDFPVEVLK